jgi:hypothetical protein
MRDFLERPAPAETWLCFGAAALALTAICALVVVRTTEFWYDESWYLSSVRDFERQGLSTEFLRGLPGPAGPLFAWVHYLLEPLTGLRPLPTRLANIVLFLLMVMAVSSAARASGVRFATLRAPQILGAPMIYGSVGTALTEVPAMLAFALHLALVFRLLRESEENPRLALGLGIVAGVVGGFAVAGRQTFLASVLALPLLGLGARRAWPALAACGLSTLILPAFIFAAWGGLTPPKIAFVGAGFSPANVFTAFAYAGIVYAIYDFAWVLERARLHAGIVLTALVGNLALGLIEHAPLSGTASSLLPAWSLELYSRCFGGLFLGCGVVFMRKLVEMLLEPNPTQRYLAFAVILILGSALKVTIPYAGRYMAGAVPLLLLLALHRAPDTKWKAGRIALASVIGLGSLHTYIVHSMRLNVPPHVVLEQRESSEGTRAQPR